MKPERVRWGVQTESLNMSGWISSKGGKEMKEAKLAYESQVCEVSNGIVVKIGCKIFVGKKDDLKCLVEYYKGNMPVAYKKYLGCMKPYRDTTEVIEEAICGDTVGEGRACPAPSFITADCDIKIWRVANGWVIFKYSTASIAQTEKQLLEIIK